MSSLYPHGLKMSWVQEADIYFVHLSMTGPSMCYAFHFRNNISSLVFSIPLLQRFATDVLKSLNWRISSFSYWFLLISHHFAFSVLHCRNLLSNSYLFLPSDYLISFIVMSMFSYFYLKKFSFFTDVICSFFCLILVNILDIYIYIYISIYNFYKSV